MYDGCFKFDAKECKKTVRKLLVMTNHTLENESLKIVEITKCLM